ncbi:hypothetical protein GGR50DRAFT_333732 [Xylaria sp. CBS 124048]|nr:hypothetical protein GGR50DRAFT_333732 [Xylaria sp. CBS 124048]
MDSQESSPPRKRSRVPHRHSHHRFHRSHSEAESTKRKLHFNLERLKQASDAPDSNTIVENWLRKAATTLPTELQAEIKSQQKHPKDRNVSPSRLHTKTVDPVWRPQHIPPARGSLSPHLPPLLNRERNSKRYKRKPGSSSIIDLSYTCGDTRRRSRKENSPHRRESSRHEPPSHDKLDNRGVSSPLSHVIAAPTFEKRPRHKTRADKYDTKKSRGHERKNKSPDPEEHHPKKSRRRGKKIHVNGKNVMDRFASDAVLNDRITVQPNLRPGLFENKRVSKKRPVADLYFTSMPLRAHQDHDTQNGRTSSKLSENQRKSRELEHVSSFFRPTLTDSLTLRKPRSIKSKIYEGTGKERSTYEDNVKPALRQYSLTAQSSSDALHESHRQNSLEDRDIPVSSPPGTPTNSDDHTGCRTSSNRTTYFTWSSSHYSPRAGKYPVNQHPESIEAAKSARSPTPESPRLSLLATGVFRETGVHPYDVSNDQRTRTLETNGKSTPMDGNTVSHSDANQAQEPDCQSDMKHSDAETIVIIPTHLEERWKKILPPEWRSQRTPGPEESLTNEQRDVVLNMSPNVRPLSRQRIAREAHINPIREAPPADGSCRQDDREPTGKINSATRNPNSLPRELDNLAQHGISSTLGGTATTSRDAMPPPPVPSMRCDSSQPTNPRPRDPLNSSIPHQTARPPGTHGPVSHDVYIPSADTCKVISEPRGLRSEAERLIPSFDSASWIPQAKTNTIVNLEREKSLSRLDMRSTIYKGQSKEEDTPSEAFEAIQPPAVHATESMADFIARIESEFEREGSLNEGYQAEEQAFTPHPSTSAYGLEDQRTTAVSPQMNYLAERDLFEHPVDLMDPIHFTEPLGSANEYDEVAAAMRGGPSSAPAEEPREDIDELLEMRQFWRPNQFSCL